MNPVDIAQHFAATHTEYLSIIVSLMSAVLAGGLIGLERSFHGRPAGFRTHTLVCLAASLLMTVTVYHSLWLPGAVKTTFTTDPTRMAQGIMTGIGFLGAGVIYREGLSVRGLTTAASIWITSAIGILTGIGFYIPAVITTVLTLGVLAIFRRIESWMPTQAYVHHSIRFDRERAISEEDLRRLLANHGFAVTSLSYRLISEGAFFEYRCIIRSSDPSKVVALAKTLRSMEVVREFKLSPTGD